jgi:integrase
MSKRANGEGSIYRRKDGRYCAAALVAGRRCAVYGRTRDEVAHKLTALLTAQQDGAAIPEGGATIATFFAGWLQGTQSTLRPRTWERYEQLVRCHLVPALGRTRLTRLQPDQLHRLYQDTLAAGSSPATVRQLHAVVHRGLSQAVRWNRVARNVAGLVDAPRVRRKEMAVLDADQVRFLLEVARGTEWEAMLTVAVTTGMREGEIVGLRWRDVDLDRAGLSVTATAQRSLRLGMLVAEPKTARSRRRIALATAAVDALRRHKTAQAAERLQAAEWADLDLVFPNGAGRHREIPRLLKDFRRLLAAAGLPRIRFHDLRHTAATLMLSRGVHPKVASEMLGHASVGITLDLYSHVSETMQRGAAATLDDILRG